MCRAARVALALLITFAAREATAQDAGGADAIVSPASNALVAIRRSEPRSEVALSLGAAIVDATERTAFGRVIPYRDGLQRGAFELEGSWAPGPRWEVFATVNALAFRWLVVGGQNDTQLSFGSTTTGATWVPISLPGGRLDAGCFVRVLWPTSQELKGVQVWGAQPGLTFRGVATRWLAWYGGVSFRVSHTWGDIAVPGASISAVGTQTGMSALAGVAFVPAPWLRIVAQLSGNLRFGRTNDQLSPGLAFRLVNGPFAAEIGATLPVLGQTRAFGTVARVSWRLDR
jgi:hypothetical protein